MLRRTSFLAVAVLAAALVGCGGDDPARPDPGTDAAAPAAAPDPDPATTTGGARASGGAAAASGRPDATAPDSGAGDAADRPVPVPPRSWTATCPTRTTSPLGCRAVRGRVLAIQSYDPDGDGDLHVIAVGGDVTTPGVTVFDVRPSLRPERDPVKGEYVTGAGPVFRGSFGQRQIQVDVFRVWRPRD